MYIPTMEVNSWVPYQPIYMIHTLFLIAMEHTGANTAPIVYGINTARMEANTPLMEQPIHIHRLRPFWSITDQSLGMLQPTSISLATGLPF